MANLSFYVVIVAGNAEQRVAITYNVIACILLFLEITVDVSCKAYTEREKKNKTAMEKEEQPIN